MRVKDVVTYEDWKANNTDPYGACSFRYLERWASLMEEELDNGKCVKDIAKHLSYKADTEGITGAMHSFSLSVLCKCWEYGEELREWHNEEYNIH